MLPTPSKHDERKASVSETFKTAPPLNPSQTSKRPNSTPGAFTSLHTATDSEDDVPNDRPLGGEHGKYHSLRSEFTNVEEDDEAEDDWDCFPDLDKGESGGGGNRSQKRCYEEAHSSYWNTWCDSPVLNINSSSTPPTLSHQFDHILNWGTVRVIVIAHRQ
eukprot:GHVN01031506.1.p1 GENE.GHVN01031506.1~~GHVN01031506.1.p1  ORF type:complete len:161 (+),score=35.77 GHVN01031506.1:647-1129(+)